MAQEVIGLKVGNSRECPRNVPERPLRPKGGRGPAKGCRSTCMEGGVSHSGSAIVDPFQELAGKLLTRITNRKLDWVLGASTNVRTWVMNCPNPG